jgi:hypothetical protein
MRNKIVYRDGYKYQLLKSIKVQTEIKPPADIHFSFLKLDTDGLLRIRAGYAWDGATGALDTKNFMRGSLVHDALYQLMSENRLDLSWREQADKELVKICREDGMSWIRSKWVYAAVRSCGLVALTAKRIPLLAP